MRALSQIDRLETEWTGGDATQTVKIPETDATPLVIRVKVYQNSSCLIDAHFNKSVITVGRSSKSDIVLPERHISRHHFQFYVEHQQLFAVVAPGKSPLRHAGQVVKAVVLDSEDTLKLGPYRLKVQIIRGENSTRSAGDLRYQIVYDGQLKLNYPAARVARKMKAALKLDGPQTAALFSGKPVVIKRDLDLKQAIQCKKTFEKLGAIVDVQAAIGTAAPEVKPLNGTPVKALTKETAGIRSGADSDAPDLEIGEGEPRNGKQVAQLVDEDPAALARGIPLKSAAAEPDDDIDEDEDDCEADFSLKEKLSAKGHCTRRPQNRNVNNDRVIEVFRFRNAEVIDARYLSRNENYDLETNRKRFRLIRKNGSDRSYWYFDDRFKGTVKSGGSRAIPISVLQVDENLFRKRKRLYRIPLADSDEVCLNDGCHDYLIRTVFPSLSPVVAEGRPQKKLNWRHGAISVLAHLLFLLLIAFPLSTKKMVPEPETRFVQVDPHLMDKIQQKDKPVVKPPPPKPKTQKPKPAVKPARKKTPVKKKAVAKKKPPVRKKSTRVAKKPVKTSKKRASSKSGRKSGRSVASKHPQAGGGHGKGNTTNRNVKQVGLLAMLGDSTDSTVKTDVADVTNLDAVKARNSGQAKFKVGGIKGKLGTSEISVSGGEVVATKGNSQVLRSYGASGSGGVAALEKGSVGQKQVKGMVQARLSKSVRIRGGMSREAVKRVIQQHLDEITFCYETALVSNPSIKGKITMEWKIRMSGAVGEVRIKSSTIRSPEIYDCIKSAIKSWQFPKPVGNEVVVSYPFIFDVVGF